MQRGRGGMGDFFGFGDPFAGFWGFGRPGGLISSFFGGSDPFDDPFFTQPFGGMMGPSIFGRSMFGGGGNPFGDPVHAGFLEDQPPQPKKSKGPIIRELTSEDEVAEQEEEGAERKDNSRKHPRSCKEPRVQDPDEELEEKRSKRMKQRPVYKSFCSSTVTYGGPNGVYYTASTSRKSRGDGVTVEESREADTTTGIATHRICRGIGDKGHSVARQLNSDGRVDTVQTLHNLGEDELAGFEQSWKGNARQHLLGWNQGVDMPDDRNNSVQAGQSSRGWALPAAEQQLVGSVAGTPRRNLSNGRR